MIDGDLQGMPQQGGILLSATVEQADHLEPCGLPRCLHVAVHVRLGVAGGHDR